MVPTRLWMRRAIVRTSPNGSGRSGWSGKSRKQNRTELEHARTHTMDTAFYVKPETSAERQEFYQRLNGKNTAPLWEYLARLVTPEPQTGCLPALWRYEDMRPLLMEAGELITA